MLSWALPLCVTVLGYGLAAGMWPPGLKPAAFCVLFALTKCITNWGAWGISGCPNPFKAPAFLRWAFLGQLLNGVAWIFYFKALSSDQTALAQTVTAAYTAVACILALIFLRERVVPVQMVGIAIVIGAGLTLGWSGGGTGGGESHWLRDSLITVAFWAASVTVFKHAYNQEGSSDAVFFLVNWIAMLLTVLPYGLATLEGSFWSPLGLLIVALYCVGDLTLFAAISRGPASIVSPVSGLYPLPTVLYMAVVLKVPITAVQWAAILAVLVAIVMIVPENENPVLRLLGRKPHPVEGAALPLGMGGEVPGHEHEILTNDNT